MYYVYIIECENGSLYTGITTDVLRRFDEHKGKLKNGAKYTRAFKPKKISACFIVENRSEALKLEYKIKSLKKSEKLSLIKAYNKAIKGSKTKV